MRALIDPFLKPVPKNLYPEYYVVIKEPICMDQVEKKINKKEYQSLTEYKDDIRLLCSNARTFNDDGSQLYSDANEIEVSFSTLLLHLENMLTLPADTLYQKARRGDCRAS